MKKQHYLFMLYLFVFLLKACEKNGASAEGMKDDDSDDDLIAQAEVQIKIAGNDYSFDLSDEEIPDDVVFMDESVSFKLVNKLDQTLNVKVAGPDIYNNTPVEFLAVPNLPFKAEENLASITFYDPTEEPLTNDATKYFIDGTVVVHKLTSSGIELSYDGQGFPGGSFSNNTEGRFSVQLQLEYNGFELVDMRNQ